MRKVLFYLTIILCSCNPNRIETYGIPLPYYNSAELTPEWPEEGKIPTPHRIGNFTLLSQNGELVTSETVAGKIYAANFFFTTCPGVCRTMTKELMAVQEAFGKDPDILLLSHSVMPWVDTVDQLRHFAELHDIDGSFWKLLTGSKEDIYRLARESYFADEGFGKQVTGPSDFLHTENVMLIDRNGRVRGVYNGTSRLEVGHLIEDIMQLKNEGRL